MNRKNVYLFLCILGAAIPYSQFVPWVMENGLQLGLLVRQLFANRISAFFGLDVLVSSVVLSVFMGVEGRLLRIRFRWMAIVGLCAVGVSFLSARTRAGRIAGRSRRSSGGKDLTESASRCY